MCQNHFANPLQLTAPIYNKPPDSSLLKSDFTRNEEKFMFLKCYWQTTPDHAAAKQPDLGIRINLTLHTKTKAAHKSMRAAFAWHTTRV
ncbi:hypothetical protein GZ77_01205 [Endozoicomonas montiporae]|uniref:Uncharacterized protein n=1 Tax=Endozoicomonas montiporae TaxID=1027273 RepID=A0A081NA32_9GAMM|nr:hypothetical protein [Endozoicomonas montiporae]KEQ15305.1 hypothetical protein GZ77_01205 [Endozoicomonas montiporae]